MGGNVFKQYPVRRVLCEELPDVLIGLSSMLTSFDRRFTTEYLISALLGSAGKQHSSGDLDFAVDNTVWSKKEYKALAEFLRTKVPTDTKGMNGNQLYTLYPTEHHYFQVDFPYGDLEFLQFSHFSPGLDKSPFKGIWLSTAKCVLAKMKIFYRYEENNEVIARVNFELDLMHGMHVVCKARKKEGLSKVDLDWFETNWLKNHQNVPYGC